jgi:hypothetical protein
MPTMTTRPNMVQWNAIAPARYRCTMGRGWEDFKGSMGMARVHQSWGLSAIVADERRLENPVGKSRGKSVPIRAPPAPQSAPRE